MRRKTQVVKLPELGATVYHRFFKEWGPGKVVGFRDEGAVVKFRDIDRGRNPNPVRVPFDHLRPPNKRKGDQ